MSSSLMEKTKAAAAEAGLALDEPSAAFALGVAAAEGDQQERLFPSANPENNTLTWRPLSVAGTVRTQCARYHDSRGHFQETFHCGKYKDAVDYSTNPWKQTSW